MADAECLATDNKVAANENSLPGESHEEERDEVKEVLKLSENHTAWMRRVRVVVFLSLLLTGVAVTGTTYILSRQEQDKSFHLAVSRKYMAASRTSSAGLTFSK